MKKGTWVKNQFKLFKKCKQPASRYRDVLLITSFIESVIREEASNSRSGTLRQFKNSLKDLGLNIDTQNEKQSNYASNCKYKKACLKEINELRVQRNELLHDILRKKLPKEYIENLIKEMSKNIEKICSSSDLLRDYFNNDADYKFDPANLV